MTKPAAKRSTDAEKAKTPLVFLHIGDVHMTDLTSKNSPTLLDRQKQLRSDLAAIVADMNSIISKDFIDFVYLPGDLAENGHKDEYDALEKILKRLKGFNVMLIPGDHDRALGDMQDFDAFRRRMETSLGLPAPFGDSDVDEPFSIYPLEHQPGSVFQYYFAGTFGGVNCVFLDTISAGRGQKGWGLDFRLGGGQLAWLETQLAAGSPSAVFMHCYPNDFHEPDSRTETAGVIWNGGVTLVEMGHTHFNEIGHDGRTTYATARSVGQNEDGPVGYAVVAIDDGVTSWRFKQLQQTWPFAVVTYPADKRLATEPLDRDAHGMVTVRAVVLSDLPAKCRCRVDTAAWQPMQRTGSCTFETRIAWPDGSRFIQVEARDDQIESPDSRFPGFGKDYIDFDSIEPASCDPAEFKPKTFPRTPGSDSFAVGSWPQKGVRGDQLGPNKLGRKW